MGHADRLGHTDAVGQFERSACPAQPDLSPAIDVLHRADALCDDLRGDREDLSEETLSDDCSSPLVAIGVFAYLPGPAFDDEVTQALGPGVAGGVQLLCEVVGGVEGNGGACEVHQREWPQSDAKRLTGDSVYLSGRAHSFLQQPAGLVEPRHEEAVDHESWSVLADDDHLAHRLAVLLDGSQRLSGRGGRWNDLDESVLGRVVEEVETDEPIRPAYRLG